MDRRDLEDAIALHALAWIAVPGAFANYVAASYAWALEGMLPFEGAHEIRWWIAFGCLLTFGIACTAAAVRDVGREKSLWIALYSISMALLTAATHLAIACGYGDCL
jgi:hypothetical protein